MTLLRTYLHKYKRVTWIFLTMLTGTTSAQSADQLSDRAAIAEQVARYSYAADARDLEAFIAIFTEDAVWKSFGPGQTEPTTVLDSREAIRTYSADLYKSVEGSRSSHHQSGLLFTELTTDTAKTQNMILVTTQGPEDAAPQVVLSGVYYDTWRKTDQGWLIATRTLRMEPLLVTGMQD